MDAAAIEQMNKLRKSLGLPLLNATPESSSARDGLKFKDHESSGAESEHEPASTLETREAAGFENFQALQSEQKRQIEREQRKRQIQKARDAAARLTKLEGKGLGDVDEDGNLDAKSWLRGQKKRQKQIERERAEALAKELEERERLAAIEYNSADLAGVQVGHEIGDFEDGTSEQILTLKDTEIGKGDESEEEDVLENAEINARDKLTEKLNLKKRKAYDVNEDDNGLLSQYDDRKRKAFTLNGSGGSIEEREAKRSQMGEKLKATFNLDILKPEAVSDYQEVKIKKPKKSKKKNLRQKSRDDDDDEDQVFPTTLTGQSDEMDLDDRPKTIAPKPKPVTDGLNDDEDLASALAFSRRAALKKQKRKPEDIVKELQEQDDDRVPKDETEGGLTLDDTTNFLDNLSSRPVEAKPSATMQKSIERDEEDSSEEGVEDAKDTPMEDYSVVENEEELLDRLRREQATNTPEVSHSGLNEEKTLDGGIGAALSLLRDRGLVKVADADDKNGLYKDRQRFIIEARMREHDNEAKARMQRERDRQSGKLTGLSMKEREEHARWQNTQREHQSSIQAAATFNREYRPDVQIKYVDENGRLMNQKEAFKHLSHQFHGKGSGKQKTEKHLKKIADEKRRMAASVLDSSQATGMNNAAGTTAKKNQEAGVRLA